MFSTLKSLLRKVVAYNRNGTTYSIRRLCKTIASCLEEISRGECAAYLANSGYGQPKRNPL